MNIKIRPRYPHRGRQIRKRLLVVALLIAAAAAWLHYRKQDKSFDIPLFAGAAQTRLETNTVPTANGALRPETINPGDSGAFSGAMPSSHAGTHVSALPGMKGNATFSGAGNRGSKPAGDREEYRDGSENEGQDDNAAESRTDGRTNDRSNAQPDRYTDFTGEREAPPDGQDSSQSPAPAVSKQNGTRTEPLPGLFPNVGELAGEAEKTGESPEEEEQTLDEPLLLSPGDMPFDGVELDEVSEELSQKYAGTPSGKWGERVTGVTTHLDLSEREDSTPDPLIIALTFDACGGGKDGYDAELIQFLRERRIPATLFVTSLWLRKNPERLKELAADPLFEIAAHGEMHRPCSVDGKSVYNIQGTASIRELIQEVLGNAREIAAHTGRHPLWFRSGTAFYDELAVEIIQDLGMGIAGYSITADQGATLPAARVAANTLKAKNGDILLYHMNKPRSGTREGLKQALPVLIERGATFVRLSDKL